MGDHYIELIGGKADGLMIWIPSGRYDVYVPTKSRMSLKVWTSDDIAEPHLPASIYQINYKRGKARYIGVRPK